MIVPDKILEKAAEKIIEILIDKYDKLGMRASGKWAESLEGRTRPNSVYVYGEKYTEQLTKGRGPSERIPPVNKIYQWMQDKKNFRGEKTLSRAYAIAHTIRKEGTSWYQAGGSDLMEILEDEDVLDEFYKIIGEEIKIEISKILVRDLKNM